MTTYVISDDEAKKLGKEFSKTHPSTVMGMAKACAEVKPGFKITSARIKAVRNQGCEVFVTACRGDLCEMNNSFYKIQPPLQNASDFERRFTVLHANVCGAKPHWLITKPVAFLICVTCSALGYGTYLGVDGMVEAFSQAPRLESGISALFGSTKIFGYCVIGSFVFSVVAHGIEASIAVYYCRTTLKLDMGSSLLWGFLIFLVGFPIFTELQDLLAVHSENLKSH
ncbi:hypothetical protein IV203_026271 [Nitzschia inconspicua]|uniref:Uncharacterized protein n=1 Tax=Nitzschia inconspicua TaxID=303405 RepID=A0A9K3LM05_9STRA|nr:hypothetical protein IV203_006839 [Nitzschia inconspicua]KAG7362911.1 hypothetical protein IV203_026271 [Nitzschia inconspicua]